VIIRIMGATLTISNDTDDTVYVKIGPDQAAVNITSLIGLGVAGLGLGLAGIGALGAVGPASGLLAGAVSVTTALGIGDFVNSLADKVSTSLEDHGYTMIKPRSRYETGKMTLSLWQQCDCLRLKRTPSTLRIEQIIMRPIFSGSTANSTRVYEISPWIKQYNWSGFFEFNIGKDNKITSRL